MNATRTTLDASDALDYAIRAARSALVKHGADVAVDVEDVASEAVCRIVSRGLDMTAQTVAASVRNVMHEYWRARYAKRALSLDVETDDGASMLDTLSAQTDPDADERMIETVVCGLTLRVPMDRHGMDVARAVVMDAGGAVLGTGADGVRALESVRRQAERGTAHGAGVQSARATDRDAAVLNVEGMAWRDALATLETQGITLSRGALREAQRVARRRLAGLTARKA